MKSLPCGKPVSELQALLDNGCFEVDPLSGGKDICNTCPIMDKYIELIPQ